MKLLRSLLQNVLTNMVESTKEVQEGAERVQYISADLANVLQAADKVRAEVHAVERYYGQNRSDSYAC